MCLTATTLGRFRRNWNPHWSPPEPEPFRRRPVRERLHGRWDRAGFAAWRLYCHVHGLDYRDDSRMRKGLSRILRREIATRRSITLPEWRQCTEELDFLIQRRDGGLHGVLFGHCPEIQADRRLLPAVYAVLLGYPDPTPLFGAERETWEHLRNLAVPHCQACHGGEFCTLLAEAEALLSGAGRAAA